MPHDHRPRAVVVRHGQTEWSAIGRHTGREDVPLTDTGRTQARALLGRLPVGVPALVLTSPSARAADTAALAGYADAERDDDLMEWDYGAVEGRTTPEIRQERPGWDIWDDGITGGEAVEDVGARADRVIARCRAQDGECLLFAHGHVLRILAARWLDLPPGAGRHLLLDPSHWGVLDWERDSPALRAWNVG